jgi:hypothetical protein
LFFLSPSISFRDVRHKGVSLRGGCHMSQRALVTEDWPVTRYAGTALCFPCEAEDLLGVERNYHSHLVNACGRREAARVRAFLPVSDIHETAASNS